MRTLYKGSSREERGPEQVQSGDASGVMETVFKISFNV